ncbi:MULTISPECIES: hypothetical protein [Bradyrhizobium]|uniref:hypothetical protein n=1 Tax=Bradyrhizobium TaxID=374 RepID=UPI001EDABAA6|nr:hypothetical protein [Bradyrhizobium zhengyangense]MCG2645709.1 hypothetical protein [Bradyrhizobium zhengyangense]
MKRPPPEPVPGIPEAQSLRLRMVCTAVYGDGGWRVPLALGLEISLNKLYRLLHDKRSTDPTSIAVCMIELMAAERLQSERRVRKLRKLERKMRDHFEHAAAAKAALGKD